MRGLIIFTAQYLYLAILAIAVVAVVFAKRDARNDLIKLSAISLPFAFIVGKVLNHIIASPRPFVVENVSPLFLHGTDNGFPSDHTLLAITVAAIILTYNRKLGIALGILGLLVGTARVLAKVHHPIDIIGSAIIAFTCVYLSQQLLSPAFKSIRSHHQ